MRNHEFSYVCMHTCALPSTQSPPNQTTFAAISKLKHLPLSLKAETLCT